MPEDLAAAMSASDALLVGFGADLADDDFAGAAIEDPELAELDAAGADAAGAAGFAAGAAGAAADAAGADDFAAGAELDAGAAIEPPEDAAGAAIPESDFLLVFDDIFALPLAGAAESALAEPAAGAAADAAESVLLDFFDFLAEVDDAVDEPAEAPADLVEDFADEEVSEDDASDFFDFFDFLVVVVEAV